MPRSLVTGGSGFIGSHLVETLVNSGHTVTVVDNEYSNNDDFVGVMILIMSIVI